MSAADYANLACPNPDCPTYAQRGAGNLRLHGWSGRGHRIRDSRGGGRPNAGRRRAWGTRRGGNLHSDRMTTSRREESKENRCAHQGVGGRMNEPRCGPENSPVIPRQALPRP